MGSLCHRLKGFSNYMKSLKYKSPPALTIIASERKLLQCIGIIGHGKRANFLFAFFLFCLVSMLVPGMNYVLFIYKNLNDLLEAIVPVVSTSHTILKYLGLFFVRQELVEVIDDLQRFWNRRWFHYYILINYSLAKRASVHFGKTDKIVSKANVKAERIVAGYTSLVFYVAFIFSLSPIVTLILNPDEFYEKKPLPLKVNLIVMDLSIFGNYVAYLIFLGSTIILSATVVSAVDCILVVLLLHLSAHFNSLAEEFSLLGTIYNNDDEELDEWNKNVMPLTEEQEKCEFEKLKKHIDRHNDLINTVKKLEKVSSNVSLIHFMYSSMSICLVLYQINANKRNIKVVMQLFVYLFGTTLQFYMLSFYGQKIINLSTKIANATYCCEWYRFSPKFRKSLVKVILRSQKPCLLTAAKFYKVSVESFSMIMGAAGSYYTLLNSLNSE